MISDQEVREAAASMQFLKDTNPNHELAILAKYAVEELARRDAERAERERPITAEWLESIGFKKNGYGYYVKLVSDIRLEVSVLSDIDRCDVCVGGRRANWSKETRGKLLDLLAALKGGAT